jgi:tripartite-type tricarboxylate transporter receptor subunit TctC
VSFLQVAHCRSVVETIVMKAKLLAAVLVFAGCTASATAQVYPSHPVKLNVAFAPGGPMDTAGRILAEGMRGPLGQPVVVENVNGAGGTVGVGQVARAAPDGYTISFGGWNTHVVNGAIYPLSYDVLKDFEPISLISSNPYIIVARKEVPANNLKELVAWLKAYQDTATAGICNGCPQHVFAAFLESTIGTHIQLIPYRSAAPATQDLVAGRIDIIIDSPITALPQIRAGTIKAYAVTAKSRLPQAPDIPTVDEAGLPGFYGSQWFGLWAPKGTPRQDIDLLDSAVEKALADPAVRSRLTALGLQIFPREQQTPDALAAFQKAEISKWWPIIKAANIKVEE